MVVKFASKQMAQNLRFAASSIMQLDLHWKTNNTKVSVGGEKATEYKDRSTICR